MEEIRKREPAFAVSCEEILKGDFVKTEGWAPNFVKTSFGLQVSRTTLVGTVVEIDERSITLDDTTGIITVRSFEEFPAFAEIKAGDFVLVVGKIRKYNDEIYITPEVCTKLETEWNVYFKKQIDKVKELVANKKIVQEAPKAEFSDADTVVEEIVVPKNNTINYFEKVVAFIDTNDKGVGVEKVSILGEFSDIEISDILDTLIMEGDIFELKPGMFKVLK